MRRIKEIKSLKNMYIRSIQNDTIVSILYVTNREKDIVH